MRLYNREEPRFTKYRRSINDLGGFLVRSLEVGHPFDREGTQTRIEEDRVVVRDREERLRVNPLQPMSRVVGSKLAATPAVALPGSPIGWRASFQQSR